MAGILLAHQEADNCEASGWANSSRLHSSLLLATSTEGQLVQCDQESGARTHREPTHPASHIKPANCLKSPTVVGGKLSGKLRVLSEYQHHTAGTTHRRSKISRGAVRPALVHKHNNWMWLKCT